MRACLLTMVLLLSGCGSTERSRQDTPSSQSTASGTGGGGASSSSTGSTQAGSSGGSQATGSEYFIRADLDGETLTATAEVSAAWFWGLLDGSIWVTGTDGARTWNFMIRNFEGNDACAGGYITLDGPAYPQPAGLATFWEGGTCAVTVTRAAPNVGDVIEGSFGATLAASPDPALSVAVTNGRFRALRGPDDTDP